MSISGPDARAWRGHTTDDRALWNRPLGIPVQQALLDAIGELRRHPQTLVDVRPADSLRAASIEDLRPARDDLETGRGFVILRGLPTEADSVLERQAMYWLIGQMLGRPVAQNVQGTLLYDVKDTGQDVRYGARFSVTNAESSFHTDNSFGEEIVDYVGLLCQNQSLSGGLSQVVSGHSVYHRLLAEHPDVLAVLSRPFHVERRGGLRPGDTPTVQFPIFSSTGGELVIRYLRYWIEAGHEKVGQPLTSEQRNALDVLDRVAADPDLRAEFSLEAGDMFFVNNRWILHNRTAFEDHPEPERRRHLVRLWLQV
jgi:alpha-ketoglutarate-dependent taurine dioxygenase